MYGGFRIEPRLRVIYNYKVLKNVTGNIEEKMIHGIVRKSIQRGFAKNLNIKAQDVFSIEESSSWCPIY